MTHRQAKQWEFHNDVRQGRVKTKIEGDAFKLTFINELPKYKHPLPSTLSPTPATLPKLLPIPLRVYNYTKGEGDSNATLSYEFTLREQSPEDFCVYPDQIFVFTVASTGAFVCAVQIPKSETLKRDKEDNPIYTLTTDLLFLPNSIGPPPVPSGDTLIPQDSQPCLVGVGQELSPNGRHIVTREQSWKKSLSSYGLAPNEGKIIYKESMAGVQETSSKSEEIAESLGLSGSVGWGAISASTSASLNQNSMMRSEVNISSQVTNSETQFLTGNESKVRVVFMWQIEERITWWREKISLDPGLNWGLELQAQHTVTINALPMIPMVIEFADTIFTL